jgi:hypothetical protein
LGLPPDDRSEAPATRKRTVASWRKYDKPSVRKRFTRTGLCRRRVNAPVTHHGLDGFVTSVIAPARNARFSRLVVGSVVGVVEVV